MKPVLILGDYTSFHQECIYIICFLSGPLYYYSIRIFYEQKEELKKDTDEIYLKILGHDPD